MRPTTRAVPPLAIWGCRLMTALPGGPLEGRPAGGGSDPPDPGPVDPPMAKTLWLRQGNFYTDTGLTTLAAVDGDAVRGWKDESAHAKDFKSASFFPDYASDYAAGQPAAVYTPANSDFLVDSSGTNGVPMGYFGVTGFTLYAVVKPASIAVPADFGNRIISHAGSFGDNFSVGMNDSNKVYTYNQWGTLGYALATSSVALQCIRVWADAATIKVRINKDTAHEASNPWVNAPDLKDLDGFLIVGNNYGLSNGFDGGIFEVLIIDHPATAEEDAAIYDNYIALKYGLPL